MEWKKTQIIQFVFKKEYITNRYPKKKKYNLIKKKKKRLKKSAGK